MFGCTAQNLSSFCRAECHGNRLGTADGGDHFSFHQSDDLLSFGFADNALHLFVLFLIRVAKVHFFAENVQAGGENLFDTAMAGTEHRWYRWHREAQENKFI